MGFDFLDWGFPKSGTDWKSINGKPFINVSAKGRSNGLSTKINDGADFGPDTTLNASSPNQNGAPYTQTNGISEAINYALTINPTTPPTIMLLNGNFNCSAQISIQNNDSIQALIIEGQGSNATNILLAGMPADDYLFNISSNPNMATLKISNMVYYGGTNSGGLLNYESSQGGQVYLDNVEMGSGGFANYSVVIQGGGSSSTYLSLVQLTGCQGASSLSEDWYISYAHQVSFIGGNGLMTIENCFNVTAIGVHVAELQFISDNNITLLGCHETAISTSGTINSITIIGGNTYANANTITVPQNTSLTLNTLIIDGLTLMDATQNVLLIYYANTLGVTINNAQIKNLTSNNSYNFIYIPLNAPTTPSMPASGTALANTNLYPVNVYLYGGTVTEIQITKFSNFNFSTGSQTYMVFSNATGLALSGQVYKLNPSDEITITYTSAPTWEWLSD